jgi:hypothetical protein
MQAQLESRRDAEVAAASAEAPQELDVLVGARMNDRPVGRDDLRADEVVGTPGGSAGDAEGAAHKGEEADPPQRDVAFVCALRAAPLQKLQAYKRRMGWTFPGVSLLGRGFNFN